MSGKRAKMPLPAADIPVTLPALPVNPSAAAPSRADLLEKLHQRRNVLRYGAAGKQAVKTKKQAQELAARVATNTLTNDEAEKRAQLEETLRQCGGDINLFCQRSGLDPKFIPVIRDAMKDLEGGKDLKQTIADTASKVLQSVQSK
jgi:hypothetical protein